MVVESGFEINGKMSTFTFVWSESSTRIRSRMARSLVSKSKLRFKDNGFDLDLTYITKNVIAMGFPSHGTEAAYRNPMTEVQRFFNERHPGKHRIYNICSERHYPLDKFESVCHNFRFDDHNPCRLEVMEPFCRDIHEWLSQDEDNVAAIHCKAGKVRTVLLA